MKVLIVIFLLFSFDSYACKPSADFIAPSLSENFKNAEIIFKGKIISIKEIGRSKEAFGIKHQLEFLVEKALKGTKDKKMILFSYSNSCDPFAQNVSISSECLIFANRDRLVLAGVLGGEASLCDDLKTMDLRTKTIESFK